MFGGLKTGGSAERKEKKIIIIIIETDLNFQKYIWSLNHTKYLFTILIYIYLQFYVKPEKLQYFSITS